MAVSFLNKTVGRKAKDIGESHAQNKPLMQITLYTSIFIQSSTIFWRRMQALYSLRIEQEK